MTRIMDLLNGPQREALKEVVEHLDEVRVTTINGVEYDVRSGAMVDTTCADCPERLLVEVAPKGADLDLLCSMPRVATCADCGRKRVAGKRGTLVHTNTQEKPVIDLSKFSEAEMKQLAVEAREHMRQELADEIPAKRKKAKKKEAERVAKDDVLKAEARKKRKALVLPDLSIVVKGQTKEVPALDLSDEGLDLNIATTPKQRSPYNKVLYSMGRDLLSKGATLNTLADLHAELMEHSGAPVVKAKKKAKAKKAKVEAVVAQVQPDAKAKTDRDLKIATFAQVSGLSKKQARKRLEACGVI